MVGCNPLNQGGRIEARVLGVEMRGMMISVTSLRALDLETIHVIVTIIGRRVHHGVDHDLGKGKEVRKMAIGIEVTGNIGIGLEKERRGMGGIMSEIGTVTKTGNGDENGTVTVIMKGNNMTVKRKSRGAEVSENTVAGAIQLDIGRKRKEVETGKAERRVRTESYVKKKAGTVVYFHR